MTEKIYRKLKEQILDKITDLHEWHDEKILKKIGNVSWAKSVVCLHKKKENDLNSQYYRRLAYDEILSNLLVLSQVRKRIKKLKKKKKFFDVNLSNKLIENFNFSLTLDQKKVIEEIMI